MSDPLVALVPVLAVDDRVVGLVVGGSRGKGLATSASDWDVYLVIANGVNAEDVLAELDLSHPQLDLCAVLTVDEFEAHAQPGSADAWNSYNFAHLRPTLDKTGGTLQKLCDAKEYIPAEVSRDAGAALLDGYINSCFRSLKNYHDGNLTASGLDAAESVPQLVAFAFAAERRVAPYNKFLSWELAAHPLANAWWTTIEPVDGLLRIVRSGSLESQARQFNRLEPIARRLGFASTLDAWGEGQLNELRRGLA